MSRRFQDLQSPSANVNDVAFGNELCDGERMTVVFIFGELIGQRLPDPALTHKLGDQIVRATIARSTTREFRIHRIDGLELMVTTNVIVVRMRIQNDDLEIGKFIDHASNVANAETGIEHQRSVLTDNQKRNNFFKLAGLAGEIDIAITSHNVPVVDGSYMIALGYAFEQIEAGGAEFVVTDGNREYQFDGFSVIVRGKQ